MRRAHASRIAGVAVATIVAAGGAAVLAPAAFATTTTVSAQCQTDMSDLVGLAKNMQVNVQNNDITELRLNDAASVEFNSSVDCASFISQSDDARLFTATEDLPVAVSLIAEGDSTDFATGVQELQQAIDITESIQAELGLPVGGSVPQATPPNPNIPQACMTDLDVWSGDVNNMITAAENHDLTTMKNNLTAVEEFPAPTDCTPVLTSDQETQLTTAGNDFVAAVQLASPKRNPDFTDAATDLSNAKTIIFNVQTAIGFFVTI
jgi:hypothetical protein